MLVVYLPPPGFWDSGQFLTLCQTQLSQAKKYQVQVINVKFKDLQKLRMVKIQIQL